MLKSVSTQTNDNTIEQDKNKILINKKNVGEEKSTTSTKESSIKKKSLLGRKRKNTLEKGYHKKDAYDNMIKKIKPYVIEGFREWVNFSLPEKKKILKIRRQVTTNCKKLFNRILLDKSLKDIFSQKISLRFTIKNENYNKELIDEIYSENYRKIYEEAITKLNLKFREVFSIFVNGELTDELKEKLFTESNNKINNIKEKEYIKGFMKTFKYKCDFIDWVRKRDNNCDSEYINKIDDFCQNYEKYFSMKKFNKKENF